MGRNTTTGSFSMYPEQYSRHVRRRCPGFPTLYSATKRNVHNITTIDEMNISSTGILQLSMLYYTTTSQVGLEFILLKTFVPLTLHLGIPCIFEKKIASRWKRLLYTRFFISTSTASLILGQNSNNT